MITGTCARERPPTMVKKRELKPVERARIVALRDAKWKLKQIADDIGCSISTVNYTLKAYNKKGEKSSHVFETRPGRGAKRSLSASDEKYLKILCLRNRGKTIEALTKELNLSFKSPVSCSTVRRVLIGKWNLCGRVAARKPFLRKANKVKRLKWAKKHVNWTFEQWCRVLWTDESKFELFGTNKRVMIRRRPGERFKSECLLPTVKHGGGSVMIWGAMCGNGTAPLKRITQTLNKEGYHKILYRHAVPAGLSLIGKGFVLQQDNDPKHTSHLCQLYLEKKQSKGE